MQTSHSNHATVIRPTSVKKIIANLAVGIIMPIILAIILNQAFAANTMAGQKLTANAPLPLPAAKEITVPEIYAVLSSNEADNDGYVTKTKSKITGATRIYVTVQITDARPGIKVSTTISGPNGMGTEPAVSVTSKTGNIMKAFTFTNENNLWPKGEYKVEVSISTGATKTASFVIG